MADQRLQYDEEIVGAGHATKNDTANRLALVECDSDGKGLVRYLKKQTSHPETGAGEGCLYTYEVGGSPELHWRGENNATPLQMTSAGALLAGVSIAKASLFTKNGWADTSLAEDQQISVLPGYGSTRLTTGGTAIANLEADPASNAFDGDTGTSWGAGHDMVCDTSLNGSADWVGYDLGAGNSARVFKIVVVTGVNRNPQNCALDYSDDGVNWTQAEVFGGTENGGTFYCTQDHGAHRCWRWRFYSGCYTQGGYVQELELYGANSAGETWDMNRTIVIPQAINSGGTPKLSVTPVLTATDILTWYYYTEVDHPNYYAGAYLVEFNRDLKSVQWISKSLDTTWPNSGTTVLGTAVNPDKAVVIMLVAGIAGAGYIYAEVTAADTVTWNWALNYAITGRALVVEF